MYHTSDDQIINNDCTTSLPGFLMHRVLSHVLPNDLLSCCKVSKKWGALASDNKLWWPVAMQAWYTEECRPTVYPKNSRQNWKSLFLSVGSSGNASISGYTRDINNKHDYVNTYSNPNKPELDNTTENDVCDNWEEKVKTKEEQRDWYKSDRRNVREKLANRRAGRRNKIAAQSEYDNY